MPGRGHHVPPEEAVASFDSASAFFLALARALDGRDFPYLGQSRWKALPVRASVLLPRSLRCRAYAIASGREGIAVDRLVDIDLDEVADWVARTYPDRRYPAMLVGSSNGALTHLAAACGVAWLPQTLLVARHGPALLAHNPRVELHQMQDANQDALSGSQMAYFRVKWTSLPPAYQRFLDERLEPGAPVVVVRDTSTWPVTRVGARHVFQVGAQGGMVPEDYLDAPGVPAPDGTAAEAEWGFAEPLLDGLREAAHRAGHPVIELRYGHPQDPAAAVADVLRSWTRRRGGAAQRLLVSSFVVHDPWRTIATGSVPFWTFFPVESAARDLSDYLASTSYDDVDVLLFSHGVESRGLADAQTWQRIAEQARRRGRLLGVDPRTFPADFAVFARYTSALRSLPDGGLPWSPLAVDDALSGLRSAQELSVVGGRGSQGTAARSRRTAGRPSTSTSPAGR
jgi:hypothetical protein